MLKQSESADPDQVVPENVSAPPITPAQLLALFLRSADTEPGLTDETVCSFGWWKTIPGDEFPTFHARIKVTLGELRLAREAEARR